VGLYPTFEILKIIQVRKSKSSRRKSPRLLLLDFDKVVGLDEVLDELFEIFGVESKESDDVESVFFGDGVVDFVFLDETTNLGELLF
jgi:hypothetical protein